VEAEVVDISTVARGALHQEARALLTRLARIRPFSLQETMVTAAAPSPAAQLAIERFLIEHRYQLRREVLAYLEWLDRAPPTITAAEMQRRFTIVRLRFNDVTSQVDMFSEVITQRSEHDTGVWLAGLDVLAADALRIPGGYFDPPELVCYLARGPGAAIRRARTRLPGGGASPVAIVRVPRERMVGHGIASSLVHEVGHQAAALLGLVESLRERVRGVLAGAAGTARAAWGAWERWISEIIADLWSVATLGIGSTLGLIGVVSLPAWFVFRANFDDPHPMPWIRVKLSCALGDALYPGPEWARLAALWEALYPQDELVPEQRTTLAALEATFPELVTLLVEHRPTTLRGRSIREVMPIDERTPERLGAIWHACRRAHGRILELAPSLAFAVLGQARARGELSAEAEARTVERLLTYWAMRSTLDPEGERLRSASGRPAAGPVRTPALAAPQPA
jgi:hypothetical protein